MLTMAAAILGCLRAPPSRSSTRHAKEASTMLSTTPPPKAKTSQQLSIANPKTMRMNVAEYGRVLERLAINAVPAAIEAEKMRALAPRMIRAKRSTMYAVRPCLRSSDSKRLALVQKASPLSAWKVSPNLVRNSI